MYLHWKKQIYITDIYWIFFNKIGWYKGHFHKGGLYTIYEITKAKVS